MHVGDARMKHGARMKQQPSFAHPICISRRENAESKDDGD